MSYFDSCENCGIHFETRSYCWAWCQKCLDTLPKCSICNLPNDQGGDLCDLCYFKEKEAEKLKHFEILNPYASKSDIELESIWQAQCSIIQIALMRAYSKNTDNLESDQLIESANQAQKTQSLVQNEITRRSEN